MKHYKLKGLRIAHDYKQKDMAKILGITPTTYSLKENGKREFTLSEAIKISQLFNMSIEEIFITQKVNANENKLTG